MTQTLLIIIVIVLCYYYFIPKLATKSKSTTNSQSTQTNPHITNTNLNPDRGDDPELEKTLDELIQKIQQLNQQI